MPQENGSPLQEYDFHIRESNSSYDISFSITDEAVNTSCTCRQPHPCKHALYIAAGRKNKLAHAQRAQQKELLIHLGKSDDGRALLYQAQQEFDHEMTCRVCESERVIDTKKSWLGPFYKIFMPRNLRYHCRRCGWNW